MGFFKDELKNIKAFIFDVDGVLSRDTSPLNEDGDPVRTANVKDGFAIRCAVNLGFPIAVITGGITAANVVAATEGIYKAIPAEVMAKGDVSIFVGYDWFRLLVLAYRALNMFSYNPQDANFEGFILPGTNVKIEPVNGLNGTGDAFAISLSNMAIAVDLEAEETNYKLWYSEDNNDVRFRAEFKLGVDVAFISECVKFMSAI